MPSMKPPPLNRAIVDKNGMPTQELVTFMRELFIRVGKEQALTNEELAELPSLELAALETRVTTTESDIAAIQAVNTSQTTTLNTHTQKLLDLGVGRQL
jgi:hypothetical protein